MADFAAHGALGAGVVSGFLRAINAPRWAISLGGIYGAVLGAWPDAWDWIVAQLGWYPRWELYTLYHINPPWYLVIQPPFFLHWAMDKWIFHRIPGLTWWDTLGWVEITMWFVSALLIWYAFYYKRSDA
jgi:hypothetical protein